MNKIQKEITNFIGPKYPWKIISNGNCILYFMKETLTNKDPYWVPIIIDENGRIRAVYFASTIYYNKEAARQLVKKHLELQNFV